MNHKQLNINRLISGGLITNYYCSSTCRHCLYRCSPKWPKDYIDTETASLNFDKMKELGCHSVHIGGGEPLLNPKKLFKVLRIARKSKIDIEYIETNSSWFSNEKSASELLSKIITLGVSTLLVSISPFHNEFIPFYKVKGVIETCRSTGMSVFPWISDFYNEINSLDDTRKHTLQEYQKLFGDYFLHSVMWRYWISPGGRALDLIRQTNPFQTVEAILKTNKKDCGELAETNHFHMDVYGNFAPGLCAGFAIKREDLGKPLAEENYPLINRLYSKGIAGFYEFARKDYGFETNKQYPVKCELCYDIRKFLIEKGLNSPELQPNFHYE